MANYTQLARSNYFQVKDRNAWDLFCNRWNIEPISKASYEYAGYIHKDLVGFISGDDDGGIPLAPFNDEGDQLDEEADFAGELAQQLSPGWIAIIIEIGWEELRYFTGEAIAVNSNGETKHISLNEIYVQAELWGGMPITAAEY